MKATDCIRMMLEQSRGMLLGLLSDMKDLPVSTQIPEGLHHPAWAVGHAIVSEAGLVERYVVGQEPAIKWAGLFSPGNQPPADPAAYPAWTELLAEYDRVRARTLQVLAGLSDADLDRPSKAPPEAARLFGTVGQCLVMVGLHTSFHAGQIADVRRALGRKPLFR